VKPRPRPPRRRAPPVAARPTSPAPPRGSPGPGGRASSPCPPSARRASHRGPGLVLLVLVPPVPVAGRSWSSAVLVVGDAAWHPRRGGRGRALPAPAVLPLDGEGEVTWRVANPRRRPVTVAVADELATLARRETRRSGCGSPPRVATGRRDAAPPTAGDLPARHRGDRPGDRTARAGGAAGPRDPSPGGSRSTRASARARPPSCVSGAPGSSSRGTVGAGARRRDGVRGAARLRAGRRVPARRLVGDGPARAPRGAHLPGRAQPDRAGPAGHRPGGGGARGRRPAARPRHGRDAGAGDGGDAARGTAPGCSPSAPGSSVVPPRHDADQLRRISTAMHALEPELAESGYHEAFTTALTRFRRRALLVLVTELAAEAVQETLVPALPAGAAGPRGGGRLGSGSRARGLGGAGRGGARGGVPCRRAVSVDPSGVGPPPGCGGSGSTSSTPPRGARRTPDRRLPRHQGPRGAVRSTGPVDERQVDVDKRLIDWSARVGPGSAAGVGMPARFLGSASSPSPGEATSRRRSVRPDDVDEERRPHAARRPTRTAEGHGAGVT
jgi:hypothetical protein